eukprot:CAMPEP_0198123088 /NCGR_PEP_ID=MMETSP1442-20131203/36631_1 /TAXON_ID= /ORGANISM="Craspedostauros australis, Strain CCMP3328" /LENGTH=168 /DNA_ID=CAMNT_0043782241 /DNA_START=92 /DNA_END=598 /DNA_ORIENTATION=+
MGKRKRKSKSGKREEETSISPTKRSKDDSQRDDDVAAAESQPQEQPKDDRKARMARLRREMQDEDQRLAELEERQHEQAQKKIEEMNRPKPTENIIQVNQDEIEGLDEEEQMRRLLGFSGGFGSTNGEAVADNQNSAARGVSSKTKARKYRQYMNRKGGFNRALEKMD